MLYSFEVVLGYSKAHGNQGRWPASRRGRHGWARCPGPGEPISTDYRIRDLSRGLVFLVQFRTPSRKTIHISKLAAGERT